MYKTLLIATAMLCMGCSTVSFTPKHTEIPFANYRIPDSLAICNDSTSIASLVWQSYYKDENLRTLIDLGLKNNYTLHAALLQIERAESYLRVSKGSFAPSFSISASQYQQKHAIHDFAYNEHGINLNMTGWEIDLWGKLRSTKRAKMADLLAKESSAQAVKIKLIADIATNYYRLICLDAKLMAVNNIITSNETILSRQLQLKEQAHASKSHQPSVAYQNDQLKITNARSQQITLTDVAIEQAKAELYKAQAIKPDIETEIFITENAINLLLSRHNTPVKRSSLGQIIQTEEINSTVDIGVPASLLQYRPDVMAAAYAVEEAYHLHDAAKAALYPSFTIRGGIGIMSSFNADIDDFPRSIVHNLFTGVSQPIFQHGTLKHNKRIREIEAQQRLDNYRQTVLKACVEVSNTLVLYQKNRTKVNQLLKQNEALNKAYAYSKYLYENGQASYIDLLAAQRPMLQTRFTLAEAFAGYYIHYIELYKVLGGGTK